MSRCRLLIAVTICIGAVPALQPGPAFGADAKGSSLQSQPSQSPVRNVQAVPRPPTPDPKAGPSQSPVPPQAQRQQSLQGIPQTTPKVAPPASPPSGPQTSHGSARVEQLKREAQKAEADHKQAQDKVRKLERWEKPAQATKKAADVGVGIVSEKAGPQGKGIGLMYESVEKAILNPDPNAAAKARERDEQYKKHREEEQRRTREIQEGAAKRIQELPSKAQKEMNKYVGPAGK